jgi:PA domain
MNNRPLNAILAAVAIGIARSISATTFTIDNVNAPGVGFNDITPVAPIAGNAGTTIGQQRLIVLQQATAVWAALLNSPVEIRVQASMAPLSCTVESGLLGAAGPAAAAAGFPNAPRANTSYTIAEANSLFGADLDPGDDDIVARFNISIDGVNPDCLTGMSWWYGIDPSVTPPDTTFALLPIMIHELGHGLGFDSSEDATTGSFGTMDLPVWAYYLFDEQAGLLWKDMTAEQRVASAVNDPYLVWAGPRTNKQAGEYLKPGNALIINSPEPLAGIDEVGTASFGPQVPELGITGDLVLVDDGVAGAGTPPGTTSDGCETPFVSDVVGKIALIDRGLCVFTVKAENAQAAGAIAVIFVDNTVESAGGPLTMGGTGPTVTIPSYGIRQALGDSIKAALATATVNVTLGHANLGVNQGCVRMYAPSAIVPASSVSHFHLDAFPALLMQPQYSATVFNQVDLTLPLLADIDWSTNAEDFLFVDGFDTNPCQHVQP